MNNINSLKNICTLSVLIAGLIGCSSDKNDSKSSSPDSWSVQEPVVAREGYSEFKFSMFNSQLKSLETTDLLKFNPEEVKKTSATLSLKTDCTTTNGKQFSHKFSEPLKVQYKIFEFLNSEILTLSPGVNDKFTCRFDFLITNINGSTHKFRTSPVEVDFITEKESSQLYTSQHPVPTLARVVERFEPTNLKDYYLMPNTDESSSYQIVCTTKQAHLKNLSRKIAFDEIRFTNKGTTQAATGKLQNEFCRVYELHNNVRVVKMSPYFIIAKSESKTSLRLQQDTDVSSRIYMPGKNLDHKTYVFRNNSGYDVMLSMPRNFQLQTNLGLVFHVNAGTSEAENMAHMFMTSAELIVDGRTVNKSPSSFEITVEPFGEVRFQFVVPTTALHCNGNTGFLGVIHQVTSSQPMVVIEKKVLSKKPIIEYVSNHWSLNLDSQSYSPRIVSGINLEQQNLNMPGLGSVVHNACK